VIVELGDHFVRQARDLTVIQRCRQDRVLIALMALDLILLAGDVTFVFT
jgi:hypothetical protein